MKTTLKKFILLALFLQSSILIFAFNITGNETVCKGEAGFYTLNGINAGSSYNWTIKNSSGAIVTSIPITILSVDTAKIIWPDNIFSKEIYLIIVTEKPENKIDSFFVNVWQTPTQPSVIIGETLVCNTFPYEYSADLKSGTVLNWAINGGNIVDPQNPMIPLSSFSANEITAIWNNPSSISVNREWEHIKGCKSTDLIVNVSPKNVTGSINISSGNPNVIVDNTSTFVLSHTYAVDTYHWFIQPAEAGSIKTGQGTNSVEIDWKESNTNFATVHCEVSKCGIIYSSLGAAISSYQVNIEKLAKVDYISTNSTTVCANEEITFKAILQSNCAPATSFLWNFGDGNSNVSTTSNSTIHSFNNFTNNPINYTVSVIAETNGIFTNTVTITITVNPSPNVNLQDSVPIHFTNSNSSTKILADFNYNISCSDSAFIVTLTDASKLYPGISVATYNWTITHPSGNTTTANSSQYSFTGVSGGTYTVELKIAESGGLNPCTVYKTFTLDDYPVADFTVVTQPGNANNFKSCEDNSIIFQANCQGNILAYKWSFGDNSYSYLNNSYKSYVNDPNSPNLSPTLTITDVNGCTDTKPYPFTVYNNNISVTNYFPPKTIISKGDSLQGISINLTGGTSPYTYQWYSEEVPLTGAAATAATLCGQYGGGTYWVKITDANGCYFNANLYPTPAMVIINYQTLIMNKNE